MKPEEARPGDIVLAHTTGTVARLIRWAQRIRFKDATWNHAAVVVRSGPDPLCSQATGRGVMISRLSRVAPGGRYLIVANPAPYPMESALFAMRSAGVRYGFLTIASIALNLFTPRAIRIDFRRDGTLICSALVGLALLAGGWLVPVRDYYAISPAEVAEKLGV